jgi:hypothetical protein
MDINRKWGSLFLAAALALFTAQAQAALEPESNYLCTGDLGAVSVDNLRVPEGASCTLNRTTVNGNIHVEDNASLRAYDANINGNIQANRAASVNFYAGSSVNGNIHIHRSGSAEIQAVDINGNLKLENNDRFLNAADNTIDGNLQASNNSGGLSITANQIDGNLQCDANSPPPALSGNRVTGNLEGQCAGADVDPPPAPATATQFPTHTPRTPTSTLPAPTSTPPAPTATPPSPTPGALVSNDDAYTLSGAQILVPAPGLLANDQVPGQSPVEVVLVSPPQHGSLSLGSQGEFEYQAQSGYFGADAFSYQLRSAGIESNPAAVQLTMIDQEAPTVHWTAPVQAEQRYDLQDGDQVSLEVQASDNLGLGRVVFLWWDAVNNRYVTLASLPPTPPFRIQVSASALNPAWNQIFAVAEDLAGNSSNQPYIWLYKESPGQSSLPVYLPIIGK